LLRKSLASRLKKAGLMPLMRSKVKGFVFLYVIAPLLVALIAYNALLWRQMAEQRISVMETFRDEVGQEFVSELERTLAAGAEFAYLSGETELLAHTLEASPAGVGVVPREVLDAQLNAIGRSGGTTSLSNAELINNPVTESFRSLRRAFPEITDFLLVDRAGRSVAASAAELAGEYESAAWWKLLIEERAATRFFFEGVRQDNTFSAFAMLRNDRGDPIGGVRYNIKLKPIADRLAPEDFPEASAAAIAHRFEEFRVPGSKLADEDVVPVVMHLRGRPSDEGWFRGINYSAYAMPNSARFEYPPFVYVFTKGTVINKGDIRNFVISIIVSLFILSSVGFGASFATRGMVATTQAQVDAGSWLLHQIRGEQGMPASSYAHMVNTPLFREITDWQKGYRQSLQDDMEAVAYENQRDLTLARDFQAAYLARPFPKIPTLQTPGRLRLKFSYRYKPALAIGGDFFEVVPLTPETGGVIVADVMGHGTRSALVSNILRTLIYDLRSQGANARNFLRELNRSFYNTIQALDLEFPLFASGAYMVFDMSARAATYSTAGHPCPYHLRRSQNSVETLKVAEPHGAALGIVKDEDYTGGSCRFAAGDVFIFFTDGLYEAFNHSGDEFGLIQIEKNLRRLMHRSGEEIARGLVDTIEDFTGGTVLHDDICLLVVEVEEDVLTGSKPE